MSDSNELAHIIGAMTERPWTMDRQVIDCGGHGQGTSPDDDTVTCLGPNCDGNDAAIIALANHADAFLELVRACEELSLEWSTSSHAAASAIDSIKAALAKVHAVGKDTTT